MPEAASEKIPVFSLYGEDLAPLDDAFLHIEDISSRSARHDWEIGPHTHHGLFQVLVVAQGSVEIRLDEVTTTLAAPAVVAVPAGSVHGFRFAPGTVGYVLTAAETLLARIGLRGREMIAPLWQQPIAIDFAEAPERFARLRVMLDQIAAEFAERPPGWVALLEWLAAGSLLLVARQLAATRTAAARRPDHDLFDQFRALLEAHVLQHWAVPNYAAALGVTESRLNRACRAVAHRSAFTVIQDRLALEARRKLIYIAAPVSVLAYELGFEDPAYFWRFFRRHTGLTPTEFRRQARARVAGDAV